MKNKNPFDYFDKIFCINLDSRPDRWESVQREFDKIGILDRVERLSARTSLNAGGPSGKNVCGKLKWKNLDGTIMSHMTCVKFAKENNLENVFIFEDDVYFKEYQENIFENSVNSLKNEDWNLFFLGGNIINQTVDNKVEKKSDCLYKVNLPIYAIHSYAINHTAYDRILKNHYLRVDWEKQDIISHHKRVWSMDKYLGDKIGKKYIMRKPMCFQKEGYSNINREVIEQTKLSLKSYEELFN